MIEIKYDKFGSYLVQLNSRGFIEWEIVFPKNSIYGPYLLVYKL